MMKVLRLMGWKMSKLNYLFKLQIIVGFIVIISAILFNKHEVIGGLLLVTSSLGHLVITCLIVSLVLWG